MWKDIFYDLFLDKLDGNGEVVVTIGLNEYKITEDNTIKVLNEPFCGKDVNRPSVALFKDGKLVTIHLGDKIEKDVTYEQAIQEAYKGFLSYMCFKFFMDCEEHPLAKI